MEKPQKEILTLKSWIEKEGVKNVALKMDVQQSTVRHWRRGHCLPRSIDMLSISISTKGKLSCDKMIRDFFAATEIKS